MVKRIFQTLLTAGEYDEFDDVVMVEGEFIESDEKHVPIRQVIMAVTPMNLMLACRHIVNYKHHPEVYYQTDLDPDLDGLELCTIWPLCLIRLTFSTRKYELKVHIQGKIRHYQMTNTHTNDNHVETWTGWQDRVIYLREDPYGYMKRTCEENNLPFPVQNQHAEIAQHNSGGASLVTDISTDEKNNKRRKKRRKRKTKD